MVSSQCKNTESAQQVQIAVVFIVEQIRALCPDIMTIEIDRFEYFDHLAVEIPVVQGKIFPAALLHELLDFHGWELRDETWCRKAGIKNNGILPQSVREIG